MKDNERDELWDLLGQAKGPQVSPFFSRNVLRRIREEKQPRFAWVFEAWRFSRPAAAGMVAALAVVLVVVVGSLTPETGTPPPDAGQYGAVISDAIDYQVIANLDEMLAYEENSLWTADQDTNF